MRSTLFRISLVAALALGGGLGACSDDATNALFAGPKATSSAPDQGDTPAFNATEAAPPTDRRDPTSPLCGVTAESVCFPDDDGVSQLPSTATANQCAPDAGAGAGDGDASTKTVVACRLARDNAAPQKDSDSVETYVPACSAEASQAGTDGVSCERGADCAAGFDCVASEKGAVCRHYCCTGSCEQQASQNAGSTFCDVQKLVDHGSRKAPVCVPLKPCKLSVDGDCSAEETCAIVTETGATGCIARGSAKVGEPCDEDRCESGLTCLGSPGDRRCYKLCRIDGSECPSTQACTASSIIHDMAFGVCQND